MSVRLHGNIFKAETLAAHTSFTVSQDSPLPKVIKAIKETVSSRKAFQSAFFGDNAILQRIAQNNIEINKSGQNEGLDGSFTIMLNNKVFLLQDANGRRALGISINEAAPQHAPAAQQHAAAQQQAPAVQLNVCSILSTFAVAVLLYLLSQRNIVPMNG